MATPPMPTRIPSSNAGQAADEYLGHVACRFPELGDGWVHAMTQGWGEQNLLDAATEIVVGWGRAATLKGGIR